MKYREGGVEKGIFFSRRVFPIRYNNVHIFEKSLFRNPICSIRVG